MDNKSLHQSVVGVRVLKLCFTTTLGELGRYPAWLIVRFSIKTLLVITTLIGGTCWLTSQLTPRNGLKSLGTDVPLYTGCPLTELPANAKNVTYSYGGIQTNTYYELEIEEQQFVDWIETIERFKPWPTGQTLRRFNLAEGSVTWTAISDGFGYCWQDPLAFDRAENFRYDRATGRCYYWYMPFYPE